MIRWRFAAFFVCGIVVLGGCGSSSAPSDAPLVTDLPTTSVSSTTAPPAPGPKGTLEFREVEAQYPWAGDPSEPTVPGAEQQPFPGCAKLIGESGTPTADKKAVLPDRKRTSCYVAGPTVVDGTGIDDASVLYDSTSSQWAVNVHFGNDDFLDKIAQPLVGKMIAIVFDGVVQSAPMINPGITGHDVEITGDFTKADAIRLAAGIAGIAPSSVRVDATE